MKPRIRLISPDITTIPSSTKSIIAMPLTAVIRSGAVYFSGHLAPLLEGQIETHSFRWAIAFVVLFVATLVVLSMLNHLLSYIVRATGLTGTDRALGMVFGAVRGLVIIVALVFMAQFTPVTGDVWWQESVLIPHLETIADWARKALPEAASEVAGA